MLQLQVGCNFVHLQEHFLERSLRRNGLVAKKAELGADQIAYWEGGEGQTLVLLHGFGADGTFGWSEQISVLSKHFHLIIPDLLWFGESNSRDLDFSVEHQARAITKLLKHIGVKNYDVAGISYGGIVAMQLMSQIPEEVDRAVIVDSPGPVYTREDYEALLERFHVKSASEIVLPTTFAGLDRLLRIAYRKPPYIPMIARRDVIKFVKDGPAGERAALLEQLLTDFELLKTKTTPFKGRVLIIWGSDDWMFPLEIGTRLKNYFGDNAEMTVLKGARHAPNIEYSSQFNKAILKFLLAR